MSISRDTAFDLLKKYIKDEKMIIHCLSSEAVIRGVAEHLGKDVDKWSIAGLLHDIDIEITNQNMKLHGLKAVDILRENNVDEDIIDAISMHNEEASGKKRTTEFQHALAASETITGLIYATTLVYPDKKIASIKYKSVTKRMKEKAFAASVNRDIILECEKIGIPLEKFVQISVDAMRSISDQIGL